MLRYLPIRIVRRFLSTALFGFLMIVLGNYLMFGDAMSERVHSIIDTIANKVHFASQAKRLDSAQAAIKESGETVRDLQSSRDALSVQLQSLGKRRDAVESRLRDERRRLRLLLAGEPAEPSHAELAAVLDRVQHGEQTLQELDAALGEGVRARDAADTQLSLARESLDQRETHLESQRVTVAARNALAQSESAMAKINETEANR